MTGLALTAIAALVLINGFFVAAEFALVSVRRGQLRGNSLAARLARRQQEKLDEYLSACQLGITIASLALGAIGEPTLAGLIEPVLHSVALAHLAAANAIVRLFGGTPASSHAQQASLEELRQLIGGLTEEGQLDQAEAQILQGVFTLDERRASDVMTPRTRVTALHAGETVREALESTRNSGHSRFPLLDAAGDLLGVVYGRELTEALLDGEEEPRVETFRHEIVVVPETLSLDLLLARLKEQRASICAVVDEYGLLEGVVAIEDILEEVVGEIWDEDDLPSGIRLLADGRVVCRGDTSLLDLQQYGIALDDAHVRAITIGGAIQDALGRLARPGDAIRLGPALARVLSMDGGRIKRVVVAIASTSTALAV